MKLKRLFSSKIEVRKLRFIFLIPCSLFLVSAANAEIAYDIEDPMFFETAKDLVSRTSFSVGNKRFLGSQKISYGVNGIFSLSADVKYQESFDSDQDGFSDIGLLATYRVPTDGAVKTDIFGGMNFTGAASVPNYSDTVYAAGVRVGRQWNGVTLAGTLQTSWIFDETRGMAYIDLMPDAYFRLNENWRAGIGMDFRIATDPTFDREWVKLKLLRQYGRTQYVGHVDYEFEDSEYVVGAKLNILF